jgi:hypothetical protein
MANKIKLPAPDPALKKFEILVGKWKFTGRTLDSREDNISGWNTFEWIAGGFFLKSEGELTFQGMVVKSVEIIGFDPDKKEFPSHVYSNMSGTVLSYEWNIHDKTLIHSGLNAKYTGKISEDGNTITGGWRPDKGIESAGGNTYDAVMIRIND